MNDVAWAWQSMGTAPKDGTIFLAGPVDGCIEARAVRWDEKIESWVDQFDHCSPQWWIPWPTVPAYWPES